MMRWIIVIASLLLAAGCDANDMQRGFEDAAFRPPSGFTRTDADGEVESEDEDDWRTAPRFGGLVRVSPAYPNPADEGVVYIPVNLYGTVQGGLELYAVEEDRLLPLDEVRGQTGGYVFTVTPGLIGRTGLVRLLIYDGFGDIVSYGDLMIE